jgi:hypothetical protein
MLPRLLFAMLAVAAVTSVTATFTLDDLADGYGNINYCVSHRLGGFDAEPRVSSSTKKLTV